MGWNHLRTKNDGEWDVYYVSSNTNTLAKHIRESTGMKEQNDAWDIVSFCGTN